MTEQKPSDLVPEGVSPFEVCDKCGGVFRSAQIRPVGTPEHHQHLCQSCAEVSRLRESNKALAAACNKIKRTWLYNPRTHEALFTEADRDECFELIYAALTKATEGRDGAAEPTKE